MKTSHCTHPLKAQIPFLAALLIGISLSPSWAESTSSFSASDSASASLGSLSDSVQGASNSSSKTTRLVQGDYRIDDIQVVAQDLDHHTAPRVRLLLTGLNAQDFQLWLTLPQETASQANLTPGHILHAQNRAYGLALSLGHTATVEQTSEHPAFYLLLDEPTLQDLRTRVVTL
jgi:hypothetical protein